MPLFELLRHLGRARAGNMIGRSDSPFPPGHWYHSWQNVASAIIEWSFSFSGRKSDLVDIRDVHEAVDLAHRWNDLRTIRYGIVSGEWAAVETSGELKLRMLTRDWQRAAADVLLDSRETIRPARFDAEATVRDWFLRQADSGSTEAPPDEIFAGVLKFADSLCRARIFTLPPDLILRGSITVESAVGQYAVLLAIRLLADIAWLINRDPTATMLRFPTLDVAHEYIQAWSGRSETEVIDFIKLITYRAGRSQAASAPLIKYDGGLLMPNALITEIGLERNLLRAAASDPSQFGPLGDRLGKFSSKWVQILAIPGTQIIERVKIVDRDRRMRGDIDILCLDHQSKTALAVECKWPIDPFILAEAAKIEGDIDQGIGQVRECKRLIFSGEGRMVLAGGMPDLLSYRWEWWVATPRMFDDRKLKLEADEAVTSLRYVSRLTEIDSLQSLCSKVSNVNLPVEGEDFEVVDQKMHFRGINFTNQALMITNDSWTPET